MSHEAKYDNLPRRFEETEIEVTKIWLVSSFAFFKEVQKQYIEYQNSITKVHIIKKEKKKRKFYLSF